MFNIIENKMLSHGVYKMVVTAPKIALKRKAGQFIILRVCENGERIPLTIVDSDHRNGTLTLIFQVVGKTTAMLSGMKDGDHLPDLVGPLGKPTHVENFGTVICIGGGIGVAPVYPIAKALKAAGNRVISIIGSRTKDLLILEEEMKAISDELFVTTDDGSYGFHGFVTQMLQKLIDQKMTINQVIGIGPIPMMKAVSNTTRPYNLPTVVSLNPVMVDGTGMCGGCRVTIDGKTEFVCVDGPEFNGHLVDYDELTRRNRSYLDFEKKSMEQYTEHKHKCKAEVNV